MTLSLNSKQWKKILLILVPLIISTYAGLFVYADESDGTELQEETEVTQEEQQEIEKLESKIKEYEQKIESLQSQRGTLQNEIDYLDNQVYLTQLRIQNVNNQIYATTQKIARLGQDIENLNNRLTKIATSIKYQEEVLSNRQRDHYKTDQGLPKSLDVLFFLLEPFQLDRKIQKRAYASVMQEKDQTLLAEMAQTKEAYTNQRGIFETRQEEEERLKTEVEAQRASLEAYTNQLAVQKRDKENLMATTQNDEARYQQLLQDAQEQLDSFKGFVNYAGGDIIGANKFGTGKEGWYYSQRDERWAGITIGKSNETVFNVGCLISSVAMVYKSEGKDVTPRDVARDSSRFWHTTAMMLRPWRGPGDFTPIGRSSIDANLRKRPVIVGVYAGPYGTHFVVLSKGSNGDYTMYDPWYGPDLNFSSYYSFSQIFEAAVFL